MSKNLVISMVPIRKAELHVSNKCFIHCPAEDKAKPIIY